MREIAEPEPDLDGVMVLLMKVQHTTTVERMKVRGSKIATNSAAKKCPQGFSLCVDAHRSGYAP